MSDKTIRVGVAFPHQMLEEQMAHPPGGVEYRMMPASTRVFRNLRSPIKRALDQIDSKFPCDVVEAPICAVRTDLPWIQSIACLQEAAAFDVLGLPLPRALRVAYLRKLYARDNCKQLVFWSRAGRDTLTNYGRLRDSKVLKKSVVVYPAVRQMPDNARPASDVVNILFSGTFFIKGGVNVVDAFERLQESFPSVRLRLCCDPQIDFRTADSSLRESMLARIRSNPAITLGRVKRQEMINEILPQTDIFVLPSYGDAFGFAVLEAMAWGIPVIATNFFAIPEMVDHRKTGLLVDVSRFDCWRMFQGCTVGKLPQSFRSYVSESVYRYLRMLVESPAMRRELGEAGRDVARRKFSLSVRNSQMSEIYRAAIA